MNNYVHVKTPGDVDGGKVGLSKDLCAVGKYQQVNVSTLVKQVVISPYAQDWFGELVASVARRYGLEVPVGESALAEPPTWGRSSGDEYQRPGGRSVFERVIM